MSPLSIAQLRTRLDPVWAVALVAAIGASVWAIITLGARSFWFDELFTLGLASPDTSNADAMAIITSDVHPPLYFVGVRVWLGLFGAPSEWAARSFNLIPMGLAALGAAWAARVKVEAPVALWVALFFTSFGALWYLQEARMYAFLIADSFAVCVVALVYEKVRAERPSRTFIAATAIAFVILPFAHWFAALFAGLVLFGLFVHAVLEKRLAYAIIFFVAGALLGLFAVAWILTLWSSTVGAVGNYSSGAGMELWQIRQGATGALLFAFTLNPALMLAAAWAAFRIARAPLARPVLTIVVACAVAVPALILLASFHTPVNQTRNFVGFVGPGTLLAAIGVQQAAERLKLSPVRAAGALLLVLALSLSVGLFVDRFYPALERDDWRGAGAYIRSLPGCADEEIAISHQWNSRPQGQPPGPPEHFTTSMRIYGYYVGKPERLAPVFGDDDRLPPGAGEGVCPVVLWIGLISPEESEELAARILGPARADVTRVDFRSNAVFVRAGTPQP